MNNYTGNHNSIVNQDIKSKLVGREVYTNVNQMAQYILQKSYEDNDAPFSYEDITNFYSYPEHTGTYASFAGGTEEERDAEVDRINELIEDLDEAGTTEERDAMLDDIATLNDLQPEESEIFEWWIVSSWFCSKLKALGQCVIEDQNLWGRCSTGQAILLDHVIGQIAAEMEILEGQSNSWINMK